MEYESPTAAHSRLNVGMDTLYRLLKEDRVEGAVRVGSRWQIPVNARILPERTPPQQAQAKDPWSYLPPAFR